MLAGVAPLARDSGKREGSVSAGADVPSSEPPSMPTLAAIRYNPVLRAFYHRLVDRASRRKSP